MSLSLQKTIDSPVELTGRGLFSGESCRLRFVPAPADSGIVFVRTDLPAPVRIAADIQNVGKRARRTSLVNGSIAVETVEHVLSAVVGLGIDNVAIELTAPETPSFDGSAKAFAEALVRAGVREQQAERQEFVLAESLTVSDSEAVLAAMPGPTDGLDVLYDLDYSATPGCATTSRWATAFRWAPTRGSARTPRPGRSWRARPPCRRGRRSASSRPGSAFRIC